jgi:hypothetical protein
MSFANGYNSQHTDGNHTENISAQTGVTQTNSISIDPNRANVFFDRTLSNFVTEPQNTKTIARLSQLVATRLQRANTEELSYMLGSLDRAIQIAMHGDQDLEKAFSKAGLSENSSTKVVAVNPIAHTTLNIIKDLVISQMYHALEVEYEKKLYMFIESEEIRSLLCALKDDEPLSEQMIKDSQKLRGSIPFLIRCNLIEESTQPEDLGICYRLTELGVQVVESGFNQTDISSKL